MHTSRSQLDRLLDPENVTVQLDTVMKAAAALGKNMHIEFVDKREFQYNFPLDLPNSQYIGLIPNARPLKKDNKMQPPYYINVGN